MMTYAQRIRQIKQYRRKALATPISATWDEQDRDSYLWYLQKTESKLKSELETGTDK